MENQNQQRISIRSVHGSVGGVGLCSSSSAHQDLPDGGADGGHGGRHVLVGELGVGGEPDGGARRVGLLRPQVGRHRQRHAPRLGAGGHGAKERLLVGPGDSIV